VINPSAQLARARDAKRKNDMRVIKRALEAYSIDNGHYPITGGYCCSYWIFSTAAGSWITGLDPYLKAVPKDPKNNAAYPWALTNTQFSYAYASAGPHYNLVGHLETAEDSLTCAKTGYYLFISSDSGTGSNWCVPASYNQQIFTTTDLDL
ncbi:MAG: type II secretion system protein GspG, partial [bacterium]|nr:type II secretion system protein GspG [bacterium]